MSIPVGLLILMTQAASPGCADMSALIASVDRQFKEGELELAASEAHEALSCPNATAEDRVTLHLKLAGIHDREGLHNNSRPVRAALTSIEAAFESADPADPKSQAAINLARARYYYRSESPDSGYPVSREFAREALVLFEDLGDFHGQADIVHLTGLFHLQRRELDQALAYFERSLALEVRSEAVRPIMLADYERHVGFVHQFRGDLEQAIHNFERSFVTRRDNGLDDQAMFAAISLGRVLVSANRAEEARAPLDFAAETAESLNSPEGRVRAGMASGQMHEQLGNREAAIEAYQSTLAAARKIDRTSFIELAGAALGRLRDVP